MVSEYPKPNCYKIFLSALLGAAGQVGLGDRVGKMVLFYFQTQDEIKEKTVSVPHSRSFRRGSVVGRKEFQDTESWASKSPTHSPGN